MSPASSINRSSTNKASSTRHRIALIDADSILYAVALSAEMKVAAREEGEAPTWFQTRSVEECYGEVVDKAEALVGDTLADDAILCLTTFKCFRYNLLPTYKANRTGQHRPMVLGELQAMVQDRRPFGVISVRGLEADDVCAISSGHLQMTPLREPVVVSIDKDLKGVPGLVYNPMKRLEGIVEVSEDMADDQFLYQTLVGDAVDGYSGAPGIGPKKARKLLDDCAHASLASKWEFVLEAYKKRGVPAKDALTQARVARIVRSKEWDASTRQVHLWTPGRDRPEIMDLDSLTHLRDLK